jgi:hypothetical protein
LHELWCRGGADRSLGCIDKARTDQHRCQDNGSGSFHLKSPELVIKTNAVVVLSYC